MSGLGRSWKIYVILFLFLPVWWWLGLPPLWSAVDLAEHYLTTPEWEHCNEVCPHPSSPIDPPQPSALTAVFYDAPVPHEPLIVRLPRDQTIRKPPPPLFCSISHSLRAPPSLTLA